MGQLIEQLPLVDGFKQNFNLTVTDWLPFYWKGYRQTTYYTYLLEFVGNEHLIPRFSKSVRSSIKQAEKAKLRCVHGLSLEAFYEIYQMTYRRQGLGTPFTFGQFQREDEALREKEARQLFFALDEQDNIHSALYLIWDNTSSYAHHLGNNPVFRSSCAGVFMLWEGIRYTRDILRLRSINFEGSMMKNVEPILRGFNCRQEPYFFVWKYHSKLYQMLDYLLGGSPRFYGRPATP